MFALVRLKMLRVLALAFVVGSAAGCGDEAVKVSGGAEGPGPATAKAKKAAEAESKVIKSSKLR